jgi:hypothetical protein
VNAYASNAEIGAALRILRAGCEQSFALASATITTTTTNFESSAAWSSDSKGDEGQSKDNGGFEEMHTVLRM